MKIKFIKQVDHIKAGTIRDFNPKLCEQLIDGGYAEAVSVKEEKSTPATKELKTPVKTKVKTKN